MEVDMSDLLRVLGDHQHKREIIHPQRSIEERFCVDKEYDVLDGIFNQLWIGLCK
jgi:hypothetical protein